MYRFSEAQKWLTEVKIPIIVKPIDSSGSIWIRKIETIDTFHSAFEYALQFSREKKVTVKKFLFRDGYQIGGDGFVVDGQLVFWGFTNVYFDISCNLLVPTGGSFPSVFNKSMLHAVHHETQRFLTLLNIKIGAFNSKIRMG